MMLAPVAVLLAVLAQGGAASTGQASLRDLYLAAAYDEVLSRVRAIDPAAITVDDHLYAALCHLALGRPAESELALEQLIRLAPGYVLPQSEVTPRIYAMFGEVRRRLLPLLVRDGYSNGRRYFDEGRFGEALAEWREVLTLLDEPELTSQRGTYVDFKDLTEGFVRLAESARSSSAAGGGAPRVYAAADEGVTPPVERYRTMPAWVPATSSRSPQTHLGQLEVIVDETGRVEQARVLRATVPTYDLALTTVARRWRFAPARLAGQPVRYRLTFPFVLGPT